MDVKLSESRERKIFLELLEQASRTPKLGNAQAVMAERYGVSLDTVKAIERKGMARDWPPLD